MNTDKTSLTSDEIDLYKKVGEALIAAEKLCKAPEVDVYEDLRGHLRDYVLYLWISATVDQQDLMNGYVLVQMKDFTNLPGSRLKSHGPGSAEEFREDHVIPAFKRAKELGLPLKIDMSDCMGFSWPFLEELFGGLFRKFGCYITHKPRPIIIVCRDDEEVVDKAWEYIEAANFADLEMK